MHVASPSRRAVVSFREITHEGEMMHARPPHSRIRSPLTLLEWDRIVERWEIEVNLGHTRFVACIITGCSHIRFLPVLSVHTHFVRMMHDYRQTKYDTQHH